MTGPRPVRGKSTRGRGAGASRGRGGRGGARGGASASSAAGPSSSNDANPDTATSSSSHPASPTAPDTNMTDAPPAQSSETVGADASSSSQAGPGPVAARAMAAVRGSRAGGRFMPRAIRRSQLDREAIAAQEVAKVEDKATLDARLKRATRGGRGGGRRARGGPPASFDRIIRGGAGGFGSGIQSSGTGRSFRPNIHSRNRDANDKVVGARSSGPSGFGRLYDAPSAGGGSSGFSSSRGGVKAEGDFFSTNNESSRPTGRRLNTDRIAELGTVHDEDTKNKEGTPILLPKGLHREEYKEPKQTYISTVDEPETADRDDAMVVSSGASENGDIFYNDNDVDMKDDGRRWPGAKEDRAVKVEGEEITEIDLLTRRRAEKKQQLKEDKEKAKYKNMGEEDLYHAEKMHKQRLLFGITSDEDSDDESKETKAERKRQIAEGSIYLFQFPPVMPPLYQVARPNATKKAVKDEPDDDVVMLNAPAHDPSKPVDLTNDEIKEEDENSGANKKQPEPEEEPEGFVGKLVIRKSGKMQIDWGGMLFDCEMAIPRRFYRECVLTEEDDEKKPDGFVGTAYGMGPVMGQFNAAPHWSEEKEWVVDPKDLPPWGVGAAPEGMEMDE